jgi:hypothetical protein
VRKAIQGSSAKRLFLAFGWIQGSWSEKIACVAKMRRYYPACSRKDKHSLAIFCKHLIFRNSSGSTLGKALAGPIYSVVILQQASKYDDSAYPNELIRLCFF